MNKDFFSVEKKCIQNILVLLANDQFADDLKNIRENYEASKKAGGKNKNGNIFDVFNQAEQLRVKYGLSEPHLPPEQAKLIETAIKNNKPKKYGTRNKSK